LALIQKNQPYNPAKGYQYEQGNTDTLLQRLS
jgi:hypothetical protein